jgi:hypothetical protein
MKFCRYGPVGVQLIKITTVLDGGILSDYSHLMRTALNAYRSGKYFEQKCGGVYTNTFVAARPLIVMLHVNYLSK